jgi:hypothetical protein
MAGDMPLAPGIGQLGYGQPAADGGAEPGAELMSRLPPAAASRSAMPCRPVPQVAFAVSKPAPSSETVNSRWLSGQDRATVAREARAYLASLRRLQDAEVDGGFGVRRVAPDTAGLDQDWQRSLAGLAQSLFLSESSVEKHVNAIFAKLDLASEQLVHRRVAAVLTFLRDAGLRPPG